MSQEPRLARLEQLLLISGLPAAYGGTGITSYTIGDLLYASAATTLSKLAGVATGNALISGGVATAPSWGKIGLTTHVSGTLAAANGGTGLATFAVGDMIYASATTPTFARLAAVATGSVLISAGANTAPVWGKVDLASAVSGTLPEGSSVAHRVTTYTTGSQNYTFPTGCKGVRYFLVGGGGGGGGGRRGLLASSRGGGGGGQGGGFTWGEFLPADLGGTVVNVTVGAGGTAGAAGAADSTDGGAGGTGGNTYIGASYVGAIASAAGGGGGGAGSTGVSGLAVNTGGQGMLWGGKAGDGGNSATTPTDAFAPAPGYGTGGGGGGGNVNTANVARAGANGAQSIAVYGRGVTSGGATSVAGGNGSTGALAAPTSTVYLGCGGGGGGGGNSAVGGAGGAGGKYGGGGGGGGASTNGFAAGAGGVGGAGVAILVAYW